MKIRSRAVASTMLLVSVVGLITGTPLHAQAANGPVFYVMNTSETPPDGVYFRNSPNWNDTSRTYGLGVFMNEQVELECYAFGQPVGPNDQLWYYVRDVTRPVNNGQPNQGMLNAHYINDGKLANQIDDGVPACVNNLPPAPPPPPAPAVQLAQGVAAPAGYRYAITLSGFAGNSSVSVTCYDSASPAGFYTFQIMTDGSGMASTQNYCYSADGPDHRVSANGVQSNHVTWGVSSGGGGGGTAPPPPPPPPPSDVRPSGQVAFPPVPDMGVRGQLPKQPTPSLATRARDAGLVAEMQTLIGFCYQVYFSHCFNYGEHFLLGSGSEQYLSMDDLLNSRTGLASLHDQYQYWLRDNVGKLLPELEQTATNSAVTKQFDTAGSTQNWAPYVASNQATDWYWALHRFSIRMRGDVWIGPADGAGARPVQIRYRSFMFDVYNFTPGQRFGFLEQLAQDGIAADFLITGASQTITMSYTTSSINPNALALQW